MAKKLVVLGTGGTIAGTAPSADDALGYTAAQIGIESLLQGLPRASTLPFEIGSEQVAQLDSKDMGFAVWQRLAARVALHLAQTDVAGVVITHGTDTLEETAFFLHLALPRSLLAQKPVVLTCAMRPATSSEADGPQNLRDALTLAAHPGAQGVLVVCAGHIHAGQDVQKIHTDRLDAFDSGDAGPVGAIKRGIVTLSRAAPLPPEMPEQSEPLHLTPLGRWPRVEIVMNYAGATGDGVDGLTSQPARLDADDASPSALAAPIRSDPLRGIVVAGTGNGTLHMDLHAALLRAQAAGIRVVRSTRCAYGHVQAVPGNPLPQISVHSPVKARIALMWALMRADQIGR